MSMHAPARAGKVRMLVSCPASMVRRPRFSTDSRVAVLVFVCAFIWSAFWPVVGAAATSSPEAGKSQSPYLVIHLDAVSSETFFELYDSGCLPNIEMAFRNGKIVRYAISPFCPGTEMVYPRLAYGGRISDAYPVAWEYLDRATGRHTSHVQTTVDLFSGIPGYALTQVVHALPGLEWLSALSLLNAPRLMRDYGVVQFFWFATDLRGHMFGKQSQQASVMQLDRFIGNLMLHMTGEPFNLVIYSDHGMSYFDYTVDPDTAMAETAAGEALFCYYPNLYLRDPAHAERIASELAGRDEIDFAFYRSGPRLVTGVHKGGEVLFSVNPAGTAYAFEGDDPFGYSDLGYAGEPLSDQSWLNLTAGSHHPAAPVQVFRYMESPLSGDVVVVIDPPKGLLTPSCPVGCHTGLTDSAVTVPVLLVGPDIDDMAIDDQFWLHTLYRDILRVDPCEPPTASREPHYLKASPHSLSLAVSPARQLYVHANVDSGGWDILGEVGVARTFNTRVWVGAGIAARQWPADEDMRTSGSSLQAALSARAEVFLGPLVLDWQNTIIPAGRCSRVSIRYEFKGGSLIEWVHPFQVRVGIMW